MIKKFDGIFAYVVNERKIYITYYVHSPLLSTVETKLIIKQGLKSKSVCVCMLMHEIYYI